MVNNAEIFLNKLIKPLVKECEFSVKNTKEFKEIFSKKIENFDPKIHCVIAIDIKQMYFSGYVVRCVSKI